jgi:peptidoglycan lytic transglycosylase
MRFVLPARRTARLGWALAVTAVLCGCASGPSRQAARTTPSEPRALAQGVDGPGANPPADLASVPDAEPRVEPIRAGGPNKPYQALGREYVPTTRDVPISERGLASWYGRKFHGRQTASGEIYDMYAMTVAHPTLPIPSYARIRNPANGREVVVRVNDRGPFVAGRIVDLSYAAAFKLDLLRGVAPVELERITFEDIRTGAWRGGGVRVAAAAPVLAATDAPPVSPPVSPPPAGAVDVPAQDVAFTAAPQGTAPAPVAVPLQVALSVPATPPVPTEARPRAGRAPAEAARGFWVQLGAFRERDGAETFRRRVGADNESSWLEPLLAIFGDTSLYRVQAGPYPNRDDAEAAAQRARSALGIVPVVLERR